MNQDDVNARVCLENRAGDGHMENYNKTEEKVSKMYHSGRWQAIETTINESVERGRRRIQESYFPDFGVILSQRGEWGSVVTDDQTFLNGFSLKI